MRMWLSMGTGQDTSTVHMVPSSQHFYFFLSFLQHLLLRLEVVFHFLQFRVEAGVELVLHLQTERGTSAAQHQHRGHGDR